jgi:hypothetical protein
MEFAGMTLDLSHSSIQKVTEGRRQKRIDDLNLVAMSELTEKERAEALATIADVSDRVSPGLDYRPEVDAAFRYRIGDALLLFWRSRAAGFAIVHTHPYAKEEIAGTVRVNTLLISPSGEGMPALDEMYRGMIRLTEKWMISERYDAAIFRVPARYSNIRDCLMKRGYSISHSDVRMTYADMKERDRPGTIHLSKWE